MHSTSAPPAMAGVRQVDRTDTPAPGLPPYDALHGVSCRNKLWQFENVRNYCTMRSRVGELIISVDCVNRFSSISAFVSEKVLTKAHER